MTDKPIYTTKNFFVQKSNIPESGLGLFANRQFKKDEILGDYKGKLLTLEDCDNYKDQSHMVDITELKNIKYAAIQPGKKMLLRYINHAPSTVNGKRVKGKKAHNVKFKNLEEYPYVQIQAIKDIDKNDEIYLNYGASFSKLFLRNDKIRDFYSKE
ncbi:MAG: SET domain-containing protein-lysine N-methyltransferase [Leptospiraceae bacterium]|nr:SET domain-containing protein-lysine N-methyltransferase [Leptospiraceae bacterium]